MKPAATMWTTVARAPLAEREGRARAVLRARRTSHNVSSRRLQSAPKARQIEAAAKEHLAPLPGAGFRARRRAAARRGIRLHRRRDRRDTWRKLWPGKGWIQSPRAKLRQKYDTSCALIAKQGVCYQCVELGRFFGSGSIVSQLTQHELIDEYQFAVCPILLGSGVTRPLRLDLLETRALPSGDVMLRYARIHSCPNWP
jgi:hypothetical protein